MFISVPVDVGRTGEEDMQRVNIRLKSCTWKNDLRSFEQLNLEQFNRINMGPFEPLDLGVFNKCISYLDNTQLPKYDLLTDGVIYVLDNSGKIFYCKIGTFIAPTFDVSVTMQGVDTEGNRIQLRHRIIKKIINIIYDSVNLSSCRIEANPSCMVIPVYGGISYDVFEDIFSALITIGIVFSVFRDV